MLIFHRLRFHARCCQHMSQRSRRSLSISGVASSTEAPLAARKAVADDQGDIFSNHGGKMVVGFLSMVGALVYRSMQGTSNADHLQGKIEEECSLEPHEVEDLRCVNDFPPSVFNDVSRKVLSSFPGGSATYPDFVSVANGSLPRPLQLGHLLDRAVLSSEASGGEYSTQFLLVAFSSAINTLVHERVLHLWQLAIAANSSGDDAEDMTLVQAEPSDVELMLDHLRTSHQIPAGRLGLSQACYRNASQLLVFANDPFHRLAVKSTRKWPIQQYERANGQKLLHLALEELHDKEAKTKGGWIERKLAPRYDPKGEKHISFEQFERILLSNSVCAWGECFRAPVTSIENT